MIVYLVRHGETNATGHGLYGRTPGISLSEAGKIQAIRIAEHLKNQPLTAIYASPLDRAMETAAPLAREKGLDVTSSEAFLEVDQGDWTGLTWQDLHADPVWRLYNAYRSGTSCPNGEMAIEVQARVAREFNRLLHRHESQHIAVISHADVIRAAVCHYSGVSLDLSLRIEITLGSISTLELRRDGAIVHELNRSVR